MRKVVVSIVVIGATLSASSGTAQAEQLVASNQERVSGTCELVLSGPSTAPNADTWIIRAQATSTALAVPSTTATWVQCYVFNSTGTVHYGHAVGASPGPHVETHGEILDLPRGSHKVCLNVGMIDEWGNEGNYGDTQVCALV